MTLFLDRDGVINVRPPGDYVRRWEDFHFLPGVLEAMPRLAARFSRIIVVTNQQGIGKGVMTEADLADIHQRMIAAIEEAGGRIDAVFHSPDLRSKPDHSRKPRPTLALRARAQFPEIEFSQSIMVGDTLSDMQFGYRLGMKTVLISTSPADIARILDEQFPVDFQCDRLETVVKLILLITEY